MRYIITIDQRTSSSKALLFDEDFNLVDRKIVPHKKYQPKDGWAEVDAEEIYNNVLLAVSCKLNIHWYSCFQHQLAGTHNTEPVLVVPVVRVAVVPVRNLAALLGAIPGTAALNPVRTRRRAGVGGAAA